MSLCGTCTARRPAAWAPWTSSNSRSPTYTARPGSVTSRARSTAPNASGCGLAQGSSLEYTAASIRWSTPSRAKIWSCSARGHSVLDSTPTLTPRSRSPRNSGRTSGSVWVCGSQNRNRVATASRPTSSPATVSSAIVNTSSSVAAMCSVRARSHTAASAASSRPATSSTRCGASTRATSRQPAWLSTLCHGVSVPPQSKVTASPPTVTILSLPTSGRLAVVGQLVVVVGGVGAVRVGVHGCRGQPGQLVDQPVLGVGRDVVRLHHGQPVVHQHVHLGPQRVPDPADPQRGHPLHARHAEQDLLGPVHQRRVHRVHQPVVDLAGG